MPLVYGQLYPIPAPWLGWGIESLSALTSETESSRRKPHLLLHRIKKVVRKREGFICLVCIVCTAATACIGDAPIGFNLLLNFVRSLGSLDSSTCFYFKFPSNLSSWYFIFLEPMLAIWGSAIKTVELLLEEGVRELEEWVIG
ncbi:hypothetical protein D9758_004571 [Tetrapyrgos nigripes]|uniref:Uncharacterized protein n=1 Tax=Tetrapyrgos nigripes TaxID=182062 RepID=A0A8H5H057_9AGAR|nr:hypothetical protein D9758_004571 [Tetrapyrgos nigripes]